MEPSPCSDGYVIKPKDATQNLDLKGMVDLGCV
jgi:hypothetical protein